MPSSTHLQHSNKVFCVSLKGAVVNENANGIIEMSYALDKVTPGTDL